MCNDPSTVAVESLTAEDLVVEFRQQVDALLEVASGASLDERGSFYNAAYWLTCSLQHLLSEELTKRIGLVMQTLEAYRSRVPTQDEKEACRELFRSLESNGTRRGTLE